MWQPFIKPYTLSTCFTNEMSVRGRLTKAGGKRVEKTVYRVPLYIIGTDIGEKLVIDTVMGSCSCEFLNLLQGCL